MTVPVSASLPYLLVTRLNGSSSTRRQRGFDSEADAIAAARRRAAATGTTPDRLTVFVFGPFPDDTPESRRPEVFAGTLAEYDARTS